MAGSAQVESILPTDTQVEPSGAKSHLVSRTFYETALFALIPAFGYAVAYSFALGRASDLGMPDQLISINLPDVYRSLAAVVAPLMLIYFLFNAVSQKWATSVMSKAGAYRLSLTMILVSVVFLHAAQATWHWWAYTIGIEFGFFFFEVLIILISARRGDGSYWDRFRRASATEVVSRPTLMTTVVTRLGPGAFIGIVAIGMTLLLSYFAGYGSAANQEVFFQREGTNTVLVAIDGSNYIFEAFSGHHLLGTLSSVPMSTQVVLMARKIGPLSTPSICYYTTC